MMILKMNVEHRTSNIEHRMTKYWSRSHGGKPGSLSRGVCVLRTFTTRVSFFGLQIQNWTLDVRCWTFIFLRKAPNSLQPKQLQPIENTSYLVL